MWTFSPSIRATCPAHFDNSIQFWFINVPSQQPDGQLHKQHNTQTQITTDSEQHTNETDTTKTNTQQTNKSTQTVNKHTLQQCSTTISRLTKCDSLPSEDIQLITNWICRSYTPAGATVCIGRTDVTQERVWGSEWELVDQ
jgi:hypothetical protein